MKRQIRGYVPDETTRNPSKARAVIWGCPTKEEATMSIMPSATDHGSGHRDHRAVIERLLASIVEGVEAAFFWTAVVLPFLHVPLLLSGLSTTPETVAFAALLGLNVFSVVVGHRHRRD